jgi:hypothetical protein
VLLVFAVVSVLVLVCGVGAVTAGGQVGGPRAVAAGRSDGGRVRTVVVGSGLTAGACVHGLGAGSGPGATAVVVREAEGGLGGRALSVPSPAARPSTAAAPNDLGAWCFQPLLHPATLRLLGALHMNYVTLTLVSPTQSFRYDGATGVRLPWGTLPPLSAPQRQSAALGDVAPEDALLWFAHTGLWRDDAAASQAALDVVATWDAPPYAALPTAFGWQDVVGRCLGTTSARFNARVTRVAVGADPGRPGAGVTLAFADGAQEPAGRVVLTVPPAALAALGGVLPEVARAARESFVTVAAAVVVATWNSVDVWWPAAGWREGMVASSTPLGRMTILGPNQVRLAVSGARDVQFWNHVFVEQGTQAALRTLGSLLRQVFPTATDPATAVCKPWPTGTVLWRASVDRAAVRALLGRPCGPRAPVWWASADAALEWPSWVEGAVQEGEAVAAALAG